MQTSELRERLASAFQADVQYNRVQRIAWADAYLLADIAMVVIKDRATVADLQHRKIVGGASPPFDVDLVFVTCSCGGLSGIFVRPDCVDEVFDGHLVEMNDLS